MNLDVHLFPWSVHSVIISWNKVSAPFPPFPSEIPIIHILVCFYYPISPLASLHSPHFFFFPFCSSDWILSNDLSLSLLILYSIRLNLLLNPNSELFSSIILQLHNLCFFYYFVSLCWPFYLVHTLFSWASRTTLCLLFWIIFQVINIFQFL